MDDVGTIYVWPLGLFYGHLVYFVVNWYILWSFGVFFPCWYVVPKDNLATLLSRPKTRYLVVLFSEEFLPPPPQNLMDTSLIKNGIIKCQFLGGADIKLFLGWKLRLRFLSLSLFFFTTHLVYYISLLELHFVAWTKKVT
jgi:hypothetical protein